MTSIIRRKSSLFMALGVWKEVGMDVPACFDDAAPEPSRAGMSGTRRGHTGMIGLSWNEESGLPRSRKRTLPWLGPLGPERVRCDSLVYPHSPVNRGGLAPARQVREQGSSAARSGLRDPTRIRVSAGTAHQPFPHMTPSDGSAALV